MKRGQRKEETSPEKKTILVVYFNERTEKKEIYVDKYEIKEGFVELTFLSPFRIIIIPSHRIVKIKDKTPQRKEPEK